MNTLLQGVYDGVLLGDPAAVKARVQQAIVAGLPVQEILDSMSRSMEKVGSLFQEGEYFIPEMLVAARAMQDGMRILQPQLLTSDVRSAGVVVIGTVKGDLHEIGKNIVSMLLEGAGFEVVDLGIDISPEKFIQAIGQHRPSILAMSALLTTTMSTMGTTIQALHGAGLRDRVKIMIGGAPVTEAYAEQIGADGYARDAPQAVTLAKALLARS